MERKQTDSPPNALLMLYIVYLNSLIRPMCSIMLGYTLVCMHVYVYMNASICELAMRKPLLPQSRK